MYKIHPAPMYRIPPNPWSEHNKHNQYSPVSRDNRISSSYPADSHKTGINPANATHMNQTYDIRTNTAHNTRINQAENQIPAIRDKTATIERSTHIKSVNSNIANLINNFVWINSGCFTMEYNKNIKNNSNPDRKLPEKKLRHKICVNGFWMGKYEITYDQFRFFLNNVLQKIKLENDKVYLNGELIFDSKCNGCGNWKDGIKWNGKKFISINNRANYPVVLVTWYGARAFAKWLSRQTGYKYRLPTETEWEFAAKARTMNLEYATATGRLSHDLANYKGTAGKDVWIFTSPVGSFPPNPLGLFDMCGNVWEWCSDIYKRNTDECINDPSKCMNYDAYDERVIRGGSALNNNSAGSLRCTFRYGTIPDYTGYGLGFRIVR